MDALGYRKVVRFPFLTFILSQWLGVEMPGTLLMKAKQQ